jgi:uncharacterized damage-inducible protein DinB
MMKNIEIQHIKTLFDKTYNGPAWHGPAVKEVINEVTFYEALKSTDRSHNIVEIVFHMIAWRNFLINKLKGEQAYDVTEEENFQKFDSLSEQEWADLKDRLENSQNELQNLLSNVDDSILNQKVGNEKYTYYVLMHGVIQHDVYHLGQIVLLKKHA